MREIHLQLRALGEDLYDAGRLRLDTPERLRLYHARSALSARAAAAASRLGTDKPSELAGALCRLSPGAYANRAKLLDGVRLLPLGRFYAGNKDVYPEIVDSWREISEPSPGLAPVRPIRPPAREHVLVPCPRLCQPVARPQAAADRILRAGDGAR